MSVEVAQAVPALLGDMHASLYEPRGTWLYAGDADCALIVAGESTAEAASTLRPPLIVLGLRDGCHFTESIASILSERASIIYLALETLPAGQTLHHVKRLLDAAGVPDVRELGPIAIAYDAPDTEAARADLLSRIAAADQAAAAMPPPAVESKKAPSPGQRLFELALEAGIELFHSPSSKGYATVPIRGHVETMRLDSRAFSLWLGWITHTQRGGLATQSAKAEAISGLQARSLYDGPEHEVHLRVAGDLNTAVYIDIGDPSWRAIEVRADGWDVIDQPPVKFERSQGLRSLPLPMHGGRADLLRAYINADDDQWALLASWATVALMPASGYPVLVLHGEHGTAKSTAARLLRAVIDPARPALRLEPDSVNNLMLAAMNSRVLAYDNLSKIRPEISDALAVISTGGGHAVRELYSNYEEALFEVCRPIVITGIDALPTRGDLLSRSILVELPRIDAESRQTETALWTSFNANSPRILGGLLDGVVAALATRETIKLLNRPRMAEFAELATAAEHGLGLPTGAVMSAYALNEHDATSIALDASPLPDFLYQLADGEPRTPTELLAALNDLADDGIRNRRDWPKAANSLSTKLKRLAPDLAAVDLIITWGSFGRGSTRRDKITITKAGPAIAPIAPVGPGPGARAILGVDRPPEADAGAPTAVRWGRPGAMGGGSATQGDVNGVGLGGDGGDGGDGC